MSENYLNKIINSKEKLTGELGKEQEAYLEFISGRWKSEQVERVNKVIVFTPAAVEEDSFSTGAVPLTTLVADSGSASKYKSETYFYVSEDDDFALKIDEKSSQEEATLTAAIISEDGKDLTDSILYCPETNKYFLGNQKNEITLSGFKNFDYKRFTFNLMQPKTKVLFVIPKGANRYTALTLNMKYSVTKHEYRNGDLVVEIENTDDIRTIVLKSSKYTDFVLLNKNEVIIQKALAEPKFELLIY